MPGYYASEEGRIFSDTKELKQYLNRGYYQFFVSRKLGITRTRTVHVAVCSAFHGPRPSKDMQARHLDGDSTNNRADNLAWGTPEQNAADKLLPGHAPPLGKLSREDVDRMREIATAMGDDLNCAEIARQFSVSRYQAWKVVTGRSWKVPA